MRKTFLQTIVVLATLLGAYLFYALAELVVALFVAQIFASTVRPLVRKLMDWRVPRSIAIAVIYLLVAGAAVGLLVLAIPPLATLFVTLFASNRLVSELNLALFRMGFFLRSQFAVYLPVMTVPPALREMLENADQTMLEQAMPLARNTSYYMGQIALAVVMSVYWLVARSSALKFLLRLSPVDHRRRIAAAWIDTEETLGAYLRGQVVLALLIGVASLVGLLIFRVPNAVALAIVAGLFEFIPFVGPFLGALPAVLVGLSVSPLTAVLIGVWYMLVQQVEGNYLVPKIMHRSIGLHPLLVMLAIFGGYYLQGVVGALLAIPIAGAVQVIVRHLWLDDALGRVDLEQENETWRAATAEIGADL
ncbi:MAG: AI-2E family transporter [Caldilineaceae bacterium]|nr:AI-2E family transporter [Caldilineaceae bacterium]